MAAASSSRAWLRRAVVTSVRGAGAAAVGGAVAWRLTQRRSGSTTEPPAGAPIGDPADLADLADLADRRGLLAAIETYLAATPHAEAPRAGVLLFVDLDRFKAINDNLGHDAGDEVLLAVARRIAAGLPAGSTLARLSSDEFVALVPAMAGTAGVVFADTLLRSIAEPVPLEHAGEVFTSASVGVVDVVAAGTAVEALRHAHTAMAAAKANRGNSVVLYDEQMQQRATQRFVLETGLRRALDRHELSLHHQPIVDIDSGSVVGFEALLRWQRGDGTSVSPATFVPVAEDTGEIIPIGAWVLLQALTQLRTWIDSGACPPQATMAVNVSPRQLVDPAFPGVVDEALRRSGVPARGLWLEITETAMIADTEAALTCLQALVAVGVRIALDDFGTGFSSLSLLQRFPLHQLKIDRAFVAGVADRPGDRALVRTIIAMAKALDLDLVAEGVETVEQLDAVRRLGCPTAQGFLLCHPLPAAEIPAAVAGGRLDTDREENRTP